MVSTNSTTERLVLGVDGGGTKTEVWLAHVDATAEPIILGRGMAGSSNPRAVGMETALANLGAAIDAAWADARLAPTAVDGAVLAMSGAGHVAVQEQIAAWANGRELAKQLWFKHDAEPVLAEGTPERWGVALIVGTGSAAIGCGPDQHRRVVGGWGYHYGDEGSAYWIGQRALETMARAADGRGPATQLTAAILDRLQVDEPRSALGALEKTGNVRGAIASLADAVDATARSGDQSAAAIVDEAAEELAAMIATLANQLSFGEEFPLALAGGVICGSGLLRDRLQAALKARSLTPNPIKLVPHPVAGCLRIARQLLTTAGCNRQ
jgi:N-acetylglucosamine kinase-like BadF-type ATPase